MTDVYLVTLRLPKAGGSPSVTRWREYGSAGLTRAVESVDWDVRQGHAASGTVHRLSSSGAELAEVYSRRAPACPPPRLPSRPGTPRRPGIPPAWRGHQPS